MPLLDLQTPAKRGKIRGRESRNQTLTTKVTETEQRAVEDAAAAEAKTTGEWLRDLALQAIETHSKGNAGSMMLPEIVGVRLLLVNALRSLAIGQTMTPEAFETLLDRISTAKYELAEKLMTEQRR